MRLRVHVLRKYIGIGLRQLLILIITTVAITAQDFRINTLKGISTVAVFVESLQTELTEAGLSADDIKTDVELKLRLAGIKVVPKDQIFDVPGAPLLHVALGARLLKVKPIPVFVVATRVELMQGVRLDREPKTLTVAATWDVSGGNTFLQSDIRGVRNDIKDYVDEFINVYLAANPRK